MLFCCTGIVATSFVCLLLLLCFSVAPGLLLSLVVLLLASCSSLVVAAKLLLLVQFFSCWVVVAFGFIFLIQRLLLFLFVSIVGTIVLLFFSYSDSKHWPGDCFEKHKNMKPCNQQMS